MRRRDVLRGAGALVTLALAGCSGDGGSPDGGPGGPPAPPSDTTADDGFEFTTTTTPDPAPNLRITKFNYREGEDGELVIPVTVENVADVRSSAVLQVKVKVAGEPYDREKRVVLDGSASTTYEFSFDATFEGFRNDGSLDFAWRDDEGDGEG